MCGIVGVFAKSEINQSLYDALMVLQHRGQDAAGILISDGSTFSLKKGNGLVSDVFHSQDMSSLKGNIGLGHVRYPTAGGTSHHEAQPFYVNSPYGIALVHNGNLTNTPELEAALFESGLRHINTRSDSEVMLNVFADELQKTTLKSASPLNGEDIFEALTQLYTRCRGGYACIALILGRGLLAFRDPFGIRPLIWGKRGDGEYMFASESVALTSQGYSILRDVAPGEGIFINAKGEVFTQVCVKDPHLSPCLFEFVYFARPDSIIDKISVYQHRIKIGNQLAQTIKNKWPDLPFDVVVPIPETSRHSAIVMAQNLGKEYREAFVKNRYIGRTFIMPGQKKRKKSVRQKLNVIPQELEGKSILLVDDSIVRGTTSKEIIEMARSAGATKVYFASCAPPVRYPNIYGMDMPTTQELVAHGRTEEEVMRFIGADGLVFLELEELVRVAKAGNPAIEKFESSVFDGIYLTGDETSYLQRVSLSRIGKDKEAFSTLTDS